ncbi:hypothetical protein OY671_008271, partial [Metschnikowia pulcherrima]
MRMELGEWPVAGNEVGASGVESAIAARGSVKRFDGFTAVDGVDISVPKGAIYGTLGPHGAGKTTTSRMLSGIIHPDAAHRRVSGCDHPTAAARRLGPPPHARAPPP